MSRIPRPVQSFKPAATWPGLSPEGTQAAQQVMAGRIPNPNRWRTRKHKFYHRIDYPAAGAVSLSLFNVQPTDFICNLPVSQQLGAEQFFKATCVRIVPETGITSASNGTLLSNAAAQTAANNHQSTYRTALPATNDSVPQMIEDLRQVFSAGALTIKVGDQPLVDNQVGLHNFPAGSMPFASGAYAGTTTANTTFLTMLFNNGDPSNLNGWFLSPAVPILPQKRISGSINFQTAVPVSQAFVLRVEIEGTLLVPANN